MRVVAALDDPPPKPAPSGMFFSKSYFIVGFCVCQQKNHNGFSIRFSVDGVCFFEVFLRMFLLSPIRICGKIQG